MVHLFYIYDIECLLDRSSAIHHYIWVHPLMLWMENPHCSKSSWSSSVITCIASLHHGVSFLHLRHSSFTWWIVSYSPFSHGGRIFVSANGGRIFVSDTVQTKVRVDKRLQPSTLFSWKWSPHVRNVSCTPLRREHVLDWCLVVANWPLHYHLTMNLAGLTRLCIFVP